MIRRTPIARSSKPIPRTSRPRRQRKSSLATLKRKLWQAFAAYVKARDGNTCISCPATGLEGGNHHAGHLFNAGHHGIIKYDPRNVHSQCGRCNVWLRGNIAHYALAFLDRYGLEEFQRLERRGQQTRGPLSRPELEDMIAALKRGGADFEMFYAEKYGL